MDITLTDKALAKLREIMAGQDARVRINLRQFGCRCRCSMDFEIKLSIDRDASKQDDYLFELYGLPFTIALGPGMEAPQSMRIGVAALPE